MGDTSIEWTDKTWNPVSGCSKVSPGCAHCYAETVALRFWPTQYPPVSYVTCSAAAGCTHADGSCAPHTESRPRVFEDVQCHEDRLDQPLRWRKPLKVFVNSMSDLFHEDVPDAFVDRVFAVMAMAPHHTFQVLTKRAARMRLYLTDAETPLRVYREFALLPGFDRVVWPALPLPNVWLGVSVENQHFADERIPLLLQTPAAVRFVSAEPLLGPADLSRWLVCAGCADEGRPHQRPVTRDVVGNCGNPRLDWVIVGGESGPGARPFDLAWARSIVAQCKAVDVPVFVKQLGARPIGSRNNWPDNIPPATNLQVIGDLGIHDRKGGDPAEWPEDLRVREFPKEHIHG